MLPSKKAFAKHQQHLVILVNKEIIEKTFLNIIKKSIGVLGYIINSYSETVGYSWCINFEMQNCVYRFIVEIFPEFSDVMLKV